MALAVAARPSKAMHVASPPKTLPKLVLLDRDGVINQDVGAPGVISLNQLQLTEGAGAAIGSLKRAGCNVVMVTNQSCLGKKLLSESGLEEIQTKLQTMLLEEDADAQLDRIYQCTSRKQDKDPRMKPNPGMVLEAIQNFQVSSDECIFIGDTFTDLQAAKAGGVSSRILVETGYGFGLMGKTSATMPPTLVTNIYSLNGDVESELVSVTPFFYSSNLNQAVAWIARMQSG